MSATASDDVHSALSSVARDELARRRLLDFAKLVNPRFEAPAHLRYLADLLERVERGEIARLAISAPPGHGKSVLLQNFVGWFLGREPQRRILTISASESLAKRNSRDTQALVRSEAWPWPEVTLANESVLEWSTNRGGEVRAIGKGGVITGFRAEGVVVDDLQSDAGSEATRQSDVDWFRGVLTTRLEPEGWVVIIQTRWNDGDIIGQLHDGESADQWLFVNLPAIALEDDVLGRPDGAALWPERWPIEKLDAKRAEVGSSVFASLYQGDPVPAGGAIFAPAWFEHRYDALPRYCFDEGVVERTIGPGPSFADAIMERREVVHKPLIVIQACDSAWKTGLTNDRSCIATLASDLNDVYVTDLWFGRLQFPDLRRVMVEIFEKHQPSRLYVEEASSGFALVSDLRASTGIPIIGVPPGRESKEARAESVTGFFEAGRVKFPRNASWMQELLGEFLRFPYGRHDDIVDAVVLGVRMMQDAIARVRFEEDHEQRLAGLRDWFAR
jgi:predicted phage terminase large subunit-like protein